MSQLNVTKSRFFFFFFLKAKHLQFVSGVDVFSYWFATYTWDLINYFVPALIILILFAAFQVDSYKDELGIVFLMLVRKRQETITHSLLPVQSGLAYSCFVYSRITCRG